MSEVVTAAPAAAPAAPALPAEGVTAQNPTESAPAAPTDAKPATGDNPETQQPKEGRHRVERKISRLYREAAEAKAERDLYKRQVEELKPKPAADPSAPRLEQYNDIEEYANAKAKYAEEKALKDHQSRQHSETRKQHVERISQEWEAATDSASAKYADFDEVVGELKPATPLAAAIMRAGPDVAYHLGKNPTEASRIAGLDPIDQFLEIGLLKAKLQATPPKPQTASKAPAPITPLSGAAPVASEGPSEQDSLGDWMKKRNKQVHGARR